MNEFLNFRRAVIALHVLAFGISAYSQKKPEWNVEAAHGPVSTVSFTTGEGTWMNVDVRPDGQEIVFDLLGDIYILPITGGKATNISSGVSWEVQPRYSPDGKQVMFTSDRGGGDNIWVMNRDGSERRQITKEDFRLLNNAVWHPSGEYFVVRKHFTAGRSLGAGEMWMYHVSGGSGLQLTKRKNDQQDAGEPAFSPDGRFVYFSEDMDGAGYFTYNKNPHDQIYIIRRYDTQDGSIEDIVTGPGGAVRPQVSPDGKKLAFVRRVRQQTVLYVHDLATGEEWPVFERLNKDQQETWAIFGLYPNYQWMPGSNEIVVWAEGKIWRVHVETKAAVNIPFQAEVKQDIAEALHFRQEVAPVTFEAKMIRHATTHPGGKSIAFHAAGHVYLKELPSAAPKRMSDSNRFEYEPAFSPDGSRLAFTTWTDEETGAVVIRDIKTGKETKLTKEKGYYHSPKWSQDGRKIVFRKGGGSDELGYAYGKETGLYLWSSDSLRKVTSDGYNPFFSPDGKRLLYSTGGGLSKSLKSCDLSGNDIRTHFTAKYAKDFVPSPDGKWIAFSELYNVYVAAFPQTGQAVELAKSADAYPVFRVTRDAGTSLHWSSDSKKLHWMLGPQYFGRELKDCFGFLPGAPDSLPPVDTAGLSLGLTLKADQPSGIIALKGARIITMKGDEVIDDGLVLVENNRIKWVGKNGGSEIPAGAKVIDLSGKTIMPGLVDVHAHLGNSGNGISPQQQWSYFTNLAYGVTTTHDPSSSTEMVFNQSEMQKTGVMVGPRIFSTGTILYGADGDFKAVVNSLDDARSHLRRMKAVGAFSVKSYNQPRREQRQQVIQAARELNMLVVPEGGSFFYHNLTMVVDGHTGIEHSIPVSPVYQDVTKLWGASKTSYTPTLIVGYGGIWGENYWYQKTEVWNNERLLKYYPRRILDARSVRRTMAPDNDFGHIGNAKACKAIMDAGTQVQLGAHGQLHGLGAHWEMWMFEQGGFSPLQAIRASTLWGADYIGMAHELGSLEPGKLADLIVMEKNPLENIRNSESISHVMLNGRLYDADTMDEVAPLQKKRKPFFFDRTKGSDAFPWHDDTHSFMGSKCGCFGHTHGIN
jgi:Tol biopolymer transport system component/imidazolonepropionase-like amidohydrolase